MLNYKPKGKVYKKSSFYTSNEKNNMNHKCLLPGPGAYNPELKQLKKSVGNIKFGN